MRFQPFLTGGCSSATSTAVSTNTESLSTSTSDFSSSSSSASTISLHSNLSLQTHPSLPSLQQSPAKSSASSASVATAILCSDTLRTAHPITSLSLRGNLLYATSGHQITVYDRSTGTILESFNAGSGSGSMKAVLFSSDGKLFSGHQDSQIRAWKVPASNRHHKLIAALPTVSDRLRHFAFPNSYVSIRRHKKILRIQHADAVSALAVGESTTGGLLYSVSWDRSLKIWSSSTLRCLESITKAHDDAVNAVTVSTDGNVYTGSADRRIRVWAKPTHHHNKVNRHALIATLEKHKSAVNALTLSEDGSALFSGSCDRSILVWEKEDSANHMAITGTLRGHRGAVLCLINVGDLLMSGSGDRTVRIWRKGSIDGKYGCLAVLEGHEKAVKSLVAEKGENGVVSVYSGSLDGEIKAWRVEIGKNCDGRINMI